VSTNNFAPLPINLVSFTATEHQCQAILQWESGSETGLKQYEVEYSLTGSQFNSLGIVNQRGSGNNYSYSYNLSNGNNTYYFRLRSTNMDGEVSYSKVLTVQASPDCANASPIKLFPVPANNTVTIAGLGIQTHSIGVLDSRGSLIQTYIINQDQADITVSALADGVYFLKVTDALGHVTILKFIKN
jgi:hypothetical protein